MIADLHKRWLAGELVGRDGFTDDGWPTVECGVIPGDGRGAKSFDHALKRYANSSWSEEVAKLGGPLARQRKRMSFNEARDHARAAGIRSSSQWQSKAGLDPRAPQDPANYYKEEWKGWQHFLGTEKKPYPTLDEILAGCDAFRQATGKWPHSNTPGDIPNVPGVKFDTADSALRNGLWGLPKTAKGIPGILAAHRGVPLRLREGGLTKSKVDAALRAHAAETPGVSPLGRSGPAPGLAITFASVYQAMRKGTVEGIPKGTMLPDYCKELGYVFRKHPVTREEAEAACRRFFERHQRRLTTNEEEPVLGGKLTGKSLDSRFRSGQIEGCGKTTLTRFNDSLKIPQISKRGRSGPLSPELVREWHPTKNGDLTPSSVTSGSPRKAWWLGACGHEWLTPVGNRTKGSGCPYCAGNRVTAQTSLAALFPEIAAEWDFTKNGDVRPETVTAKSSRKAWFLCDKGHSWEALVSNRANGSGCPACNRGWNVEAIREFVRSLAHHLSSMTPAEMYVVFQQSGALDTQGRGKAFIKALATGRFPKGEIDLFLDSKPSLVDQFFDDHTTELPATTAEIPSTSDELADAVVPDNTSDAEATDLLPTVTVHGVFAALNAAVDRASDVEAVEFLVASAKAKLWRTVFRDEDSGIAEVRHFAGAGYADTVRADFLREYEEARALAIPDGYAFAPNGKPAAPNLMQRIVASRMLRDRRGRPEACWNSGAAAT